MLTGRWTLAKGKLIDFVDGIEHVASKDGTKPARLRLSS